MKTVLLLATMLLCSSLNAQISSILPMKERARVIDEILELRVKKIIPDLMKRENIDMWIVMSREYNEDPLIKTLLPATWLAARRRTILVFHQPKNGELETLAVARYDVGSIFKKAWDKEKEPNQWKRLADIVKEKNPNKIALNYSHHFGLADGVNYTDKKEFEEHLPDNFSNRIVSAEKLAIGWLETRIEEELPYYRHLVKIAHDIIKEGFSSQVITPGITTTDDVVWWFRERVRELKLTTWFHTSVSIQRNDATEFDHMSNFTKNKTIILPGDLIHVDFGITYLRLNSDTQEHAYVLRAGETEAPKYLQNAFKRGNRLQDIFTSKFKEGKTGNDVLKEAREQSLKEGIKPSIYTHPIGYHGHAIGTTLGMWDHQDGVEGKGDYPLHLNTAYSIELNASTFIKEWNKEIRIMLEEDAFFDKTGVWYLDGRQTSLLLISAKDKHLGN